MIIKTRAIVLTSLKYGDSSRIVRFYTESKGIKSLMFKGAYAKKNRQVSLFMPLNLVELVFEEKPKHDLENFREAKNLYHYQNLHLNPAKTTISLFLTEILHHVLKEEEANPRMFQFLWTSLEIFDQKKTGYADFHLWFLFQLTKFLGFYPNLQIGAKYFDLNEGVSTNQIPSGFYISQHELTDWEKLSQLNFLTEIHPRFNQNSRNEILNNLLKYYELHIFDFQRPKSLEILKQVFD